jgi:lipopolysaccharide export system protein LptA
MRRRATAAALVLAATLALLGAQAPAQPRLPSDGPPIAIEARDGIEWDRANRRYVARGAARVTQGDRIIEAETLTAHYREPAKGGTEIYRYTATGQVRLTTATQRAFADAGVYDLDSGVVTLTGKALRIATAQHEITARDSLEYWERQRMAVARGNAVVTAEDGKRIGGDTLAAYFAAAPDGAASRAVPGIDGSAQRLDRVEAFGNVLVVTATEVAQGETGVYNARNATASLSGNVKLTRGRNQIQGDSLELNLETGLYKLGCRPGTGSSCVRGLFVPERRDEGTRTR